MVEESQEEEFLSLVFRWDVFLSFRGKDTRHNFTNSLYKELVRNNIRTFLDDEGMEGGDDLAPALSAAIEESASYIAIISENYAESRWCLEELAQMLERKELAQMLERKRRLLPVFYKVDPSDVRRQVGSFEKPFLKHEQRYGEEKVRRWRRAMVEAGDKKGWDSSTWEDLQLIRDIVKKILPKVNNGPLGVAKYPVGINSRVTELVELLDMKSNDVRVVGFHGMGGVGKTTLAKAVYNRIAAYFKCRCFIPNIRDASRQHNGLFSLEEKLIHELNKGNRGDEVIRHLNDISEKRVLIVLDDVDHTEQLHALLGIYRWLYKGSRIIITTRNKEVLREDFVNSIYEVKELSSSESLQLFSYHAFGRGKPAENFLHLSEQVVSITGRLPLALEVFGASMFNKKKEGEWKNTLEKLKIIQPANIQEVLKISYDDLDEEERCIFLDIACFFVSIGVDIESAIDIFKGCGFNAEVAVKDLTEKSLIKILDDNTLWMHDQLRDMGQALVRQEDRNNPGKRSRLWDRDDVLAVLDSKKGTGVTQGIILDFKDISEPKELAKIRNQTHPIITWLKKISENILDFKRPIDKEAELCTVPFQPMVNLRLLQINHVKLEGSFKNFPPDVKWLQWKGCPLEVLPSDFCPRKLAVLDLSESKIKQVWSKRPWWGCYEITEELQVLILHGCCNLTATPDFSAHPKLEKLILEGCQELREIHKSIGDLSRLRHCNLRRCYNLEEFPNDITGLRKLETLILSGCYKLTKLPDDLRPMKALTELLLDQTAIVKLPDSIFHLEKLERLDLKRCLSLKKLPISIGKLLSLRELTLDGSALEEIPQSIGSLKNLERLSLVGCESITTIPDSFHNLTSLLELFLGAISIEELPDSIGYLSHLEYLSVAHCKSLRKLPASIGLLSSLVELHLDFTPITELPDQIADLNMLEKLEMIDCKLLTCLPNSIGKMSNLTTLILQNCIITELPESICLLEKLEVLKVSKCKQLSRLPNSIGKLNSLCRFQMEGTAVAVLPEDFGKLSNLRMLKMAKRPQSEEPQNVEERTSLAKEGNHECMVLPASFSSLSLLYDFDARYCNISGAIPDDFEKLSSLETLLLGHNNIWSLPSSLRGLSVLTKLSLPYCAELKSLPPLPSSLEFVDVTSCTSLESISSLSNLENLEELCLPNCHKVVDIPGLECLKSLRRLYMAGCTTCHSVVNGRLSKVALRHMRFLSTPGSEIPNWFVPEVPSFSSLKNRSIKGVVICVVISLDQQIRIDCPTIPDVRAEILDNRLMPKFSTTLYLHGVPETNEDQFYFCRFPEFHPLVSLLRDGSKMQVTLRNPPIFTGLELKKYGIHLVFEDDDDYNGDEESLDESQLSLSEKLAKFFSSL